MIVDNEWISDMYGYEVMSKLVDQGSNHDFIKCPKTKRGTLAMVHLDGEKMVKIVKFTKGTTLCGQWQGMLDNRKVVNLEEGFMETNFSW